MGLGRSERVQMNKVKGESWEVIDEWDTCIYPDLIKSMYTIIWFLDFTLNSRTILQYDIRSIHFIFKYSKIYRRWIPPFNSVNIYKQRDLNHDFV